MLRGPSCHAARPTLSYRAPHTVMLRSTPLCHAARSRSIQEIVVQGFKPGRSGFRDWRAE